MYISKKITLIHRIITAGEEMSLVRLYLMVVGLLTRLREQF